MNEASACADMKQRTASLRTRRIVADYRLASSRGDIPCFGVSHGEKTILNRFHLFANLNTGSNQRVTPPKGKKKRHPEWDTVFLLEASPRFELGDRGVADLCLTTWL